TSDTIMRENECPTKTVGPLCLSRARRADATDSGKVVSGFWTAVTLSPADCSLTVTSVQLESSANKPWRNTTLAALELGWMLTVSVATALVDNNKDVIPTNRTLEMMK